MRRIALFLLTATIVSVPAAAISQELEEHRGARRVLIVYARSVDEPRSFEFNLALSTAWREVESYDLAIIDVIPGIYDVDIVARTLGIEEYDFAVLLIDRDGEIVLVSDQADSLREFLDLVYELQRNE